MGETCFTLCNLEGNKNMSVVEIRAIEKHFDDVHAVDGVDLEIQSGEFLVILGPSGCGKTTLMRMIAGLEKPTVGQMFIDGEDVTELPPRKRGVSMVFQSYALYPHMTVFKNIWVWLLCVLDSCSNTHHNIFGYYIRVR
jgi:ABC-type sugar transport system ATPase subunit